MGEEVMCMEIVGYYIYGNKGYVAFQDGKENQDAFKITDGFHDKPLYGEDTGKCQGYCKARKEDIDLDKIISRMRGTRPWHPLLDLLRKECIT